MFSRSFELKRDQIAVLIAKDFKLKYNSTALGFLWSLLVPVFSSLIYFAVFGVLMRFRIPNYLLYLLCGTFLWQFFSNVVLQNGSILLNNAGLLKKTSMNRKLFVWGTFFTESIHFLLTIPVLVVVMIAYGVRPDWLTFFPNLLAVLLLLALFSIGLSYAYAAANLFFRDLERMMRIIMQMWMFMTPIFIPESSIPAKYHWIYVVNPLAGIVRIWRNIFYEPGINCLLWLKLLVIGMAVFWVGRWIFVRLEKRFAEMM